MVTSQKNEKQPLVILKVALAGRKNVWRRIALRGEQTLEDLHNVIFDAFDRFDEHLYSFYFSQTPPGKNFHLWLRDAKEYSHSYTSKEDPDVGNAAKTKIASLGLKKDQKFYYLFDFGDEWWHEIAVESTDTPGKKVKYPRVIEKKGKSPPQYPDEDEEYDEEEE